MAQGMPEVSSSRFAQVPSGDFAGASWARSFPDLGCWAGVDQTNTLGTQDTPKYVGKFSVADYFE